MNVSSATNVANSTQVKAQQNVPRGTESREVGRDNDGDKDDGGGMHVASQAPKPTVNSVGQMIGQVVNTVA